MADTEKGENEARVEQKKKRLLLNGKRRRQRQRQEATRKPRQNVNLYDGCGAFLRQLLLKQPSDDKVAARRCNFRGKRAGTSVISTATCSEPAR